MKLSIDLASELTASAVLMLPPDADALDEIIEWRRAFKGLYFDSTDSRLINFKSLYSLVNDVYSDFAEPVEARIFSRENTILKSSNACLYDSSTGIILSESAVSRMPRHQRFPTANQFHIQLGTPISTLDWIETALVIPKISASSEGILIPELMARLWPFVVEHNLFTLQGVPVILQQNIQDSIKRTLFALLRKHGMFPLFCHHLPPYTLIKKAIIPLPSMQFLSNMSLLYFETCSNFLRAHSEIQQNSSVADTFGEYVFVFDKNATICESLEFNDLTDTLEKDGWSIVEITNLCFEERISLYENAKFMAGFDNSFWLELSFLSKNILLPSNLIVGGIPNLDVMFTFAGMNISGQWIKLFSSLDGSRNSPWLTNGKDTAKVIIDSVNFGQK